MLWSFIKVAMFLVIIAALTLGADIVVRLIPTRPELKLGVVTALIGAPFFLFLLIRLKGMER